MQPAHPTERTKSMINTVDYLSLARECLSEMLKEPMYVFRKHKPVGEYPAPEWAAGSGTILDILGNVEMPDEFKIRAFCSEMCGMEDSCLRLFAIRCIKEITFENGETAWDSLANTHRDAIGAAEKYLAGEVAVPKLREAFEKACGATDAIKRERSALFDKKHERVDTAAFDALSTSLFRAEAADFCASPGKMNFAAWRSSQLSGMGAKGNIYSQQIGIATSIVLGQPHR